MFNCCHYTFPLLAIFGNNEYGCKTAPMCEVPSCSEYLYSFVLLFWFNLVCQWSVFSHCCCLCLPNQRSIYTVTLIINWASVSYMSCLSLFKQDTSEKTTQPETNRPKHSPWSKTDSCSYDSASVYCWIGWWHSNKPVTRTQTITTMLNSGNDIPPLTDIKPARAQLKQSRVP